MDDVVSSCGSKTNKANVSVMIDQGVKKENAIF
jgi:hypothetical protein